MISTRSGTKTISYVLYVHDIDQNLLCWSIDRKGFKVSSENQLCLIFDTTGREILRVRMRGKIFSFDPIEEEQTTYFTQVSRTELWHKRLGHCHIQRMLDMKKRYMTRGLPILSDHLPNCNVCQFGKQNRMPFPKIVWRTTKKLQLIHTDVAGPQRTPSLQGSLYYIVFIDDFTRMCWIFFLNSSIKWLEFL